jgi:poly-gamma-glutamate capsule biosynthesis protein CapA/YwtB (metallophosphatase superfamily)
MEGYAQLARSNKNPNEPRASGRRPRRTRAAFVLALAALAVVLAGAVVLPGATSSGDVPEADAASDSTSTGVVISDDADETVTCDLMMVGDVLGHMGVLDSGLASDGTRSYGHLFAQVAPDAQAADIAILNQETQLGGTELGLSGYPLFNSPQELGDAEATAGFNVIACATNHTLDYGNAAVASELGFWREQHPDVLVLGIADSQEAYDEIQVFEKDGFKVALLNYTFGTNGIPIPDENPFAVRMLERAAVADDLARADELADVVVVIPHWGTEYSDVADSYQREWARFLCDHGADVIIGSHPHCLEPVEVITGADGHQALCFYSLGNFVSNQRGVREATGGMAKVELVKDSTGCYAASWELDPLVCHIAPGTDLTTYRLADYTDELASESSSGIGSVQEVQDHCAAVLGSAYDRRECRLAGGEVRFDGGLAQAA